MSPELQTDIAQTLTLGIQLAWLFWLSKQVRELRRDVYMKAVVQAGDERGEHERDKHEPV